MVNKKSLATFVRTLGNQVIAGFKHFLNNVKISGDLIHDPDPLGSTATNLLTVDPNGVVRKATSLAGATGTVTSVALTAPSAFTVTGSPITTSGTIAIDAAGTTAQYIRGDGTLAVFPTGGTGGGSSVSYYLNGSVNQGTFGGNTYYEFNKTPVIGAGTDFTISADGYIAQFITDANDPSLLEIPGGNWNLEFYFSSSSSGGTPSFYVELSKYNGTTFTPIASNSGTPEFIAFGTIISPYFATLSVPQTTLALTDRLAIRVYVIHSGRTIKLHTENSHLCQVITTFTTGLTALNGLTKQVQYFATGTSGTDFNISSSVDTHTFNIPTASGSNRGLLSTSDWTNFTAAHNDKINSAAVTGTTTKTLTLTQQDGGTITASWTDYDTAPVTSVFGRTGAVIAVSGDYNTSQVTENTNLYFTNARARTAISLTTTGTSGAATYDNLTGVLNIPQYQSVLTNPVTGTGTTNYIAKWVSGSAINNSQIFDNGTNVGIGTTSPNVTLEANGKIRSTRTNVGSQYIQIDGGDPSGPYIIAAGVAKVLSIENRSTVNSEIWFNNAVASNYIWHQVGSEVMRITAAGNLGIGTTSPGYKLEVNGTGRFNGELTVVPSSTNGVTVSRAGGYASIYGSNDLVFETNGVFYFGVYTPRLFSVNSSFYTTAGGNVGIGTASPAGYAGRILDIGGASTVSLNFHTTTSGSTQNDGATLYYGSDNSLRIVNYESDGIVRIDTQDTERMRITSGGNVGIGTTSPGQKLDVNGNVVATSFGGRVYPYNSILGSGADASTGTVFAGSTNGYVSSIDVAGGGASNPNTIIIKTASTERMRITSAGNVGIGTTAPSSLLEIAGASPVLTINRTSGTSSTINFNSSGSNFASIISNPSNGENRFSIGPAAAWGGFHTFYTDTSERMRITAAGNVGIGTTSPNEKLTVIGKVYAIPNLPVVLSGNGSPQYGTNITMASDTGATQGAVRIWSRYDGSGNAAMTFERATTTQVYNADPQLLTYSESMRISGNGNVGIGTTGPSDKLHIVGDINVGAYKVYNGSSNNSAGFELNGSRFNIHGYYGITFNSSSAGIGSQIERMRINPDGNVGIGTTSPTYKFNVVSNAVAGKQNLAAIDRTAQNFVTFTNPQYSTDASMGLLLRVFPQSDARQGAGIIASGGSNNATTDLDLFVTTSPDGLGGTSYSAIKINGLNGNVGIGTTSPASRLHVETSSSNPFRMVRTGGSATNFGYEFGSGAIGLYDYTNSTYRYYITSGGNVGIGTTSPGASLHVAGAINSTPTGDGFLAGIQSGYAVIHLNGSAATGSLIDFSVSGTDTKGRILYDNINNYFGFNTNGSERLRITSAGNVGIGTTSPSAPLTVVSQVNDGSAILTIRSSDNFGYSFARSNTTGFLEFDGNQTGNIGYVFKNGNVGIGTNNPTAALSVVRGAGAVAYIELAGNNNTIGTTSMLYGQDGGNNGYVWNRANAPIYFGTNNSTRMFLSASGNLGIGTTSPAYKLDVVGKIFSSTEIQSSAAVMNTSGGYASFGSNSGATPIRIGRDTTSNDIIINASGNVGIGTTSPSAKLHVASGNILTQGSSGGGVFNSLYVTTTASTARNWTIGASLYAFGDFVINQSNAKDGDPISAGTNRFYISSAGDVGIGTTSPSAKLHVIGNATVSATLSTAHAKITGTLADSFGLVGTAGQVLSSTGTGIEWITGGGGGGGSTIIVKDQGTTIGSSFTTLDFIGDNVNATASGSTAVIEVTGRASSGSIYYEDVATPFIIPGGGFADVEINTQTVLATVPSSLTGSNKLMATITFGVSNVSNFEGFNGFKFRLYNVSPMSDVQGTTHSWNAYMSKDEGCTTTVFTFHIPIDPSVVAGGDTIVVQADALTNYTPEIYYCALTLMEGTN